MRGLFLGMRRDGEHGGEVAWKEKGKLTNYQVCLTGSHDGKLFCHVKLEGLKCLSQCKPVFF